MYVSFPTLLPGPVKNFDVFQLYANACPELHSICSIVFAPSLNGAIGVSPKQNTTVSQLALHCNEIFQWFNTCHALKSIFIKNSGKTQNCIHLTDLSLQYMYSSKTDTANMSMLLLASTSSLFSPVSRLMRSILSVLASHQYSRPSCKENFKQYWLFGETQIQLKNVWKTSLLASW